MKKILNKCSLANTLVNEYRELLTLSIDINICLIVYFVCFVISDTCFCLHADTL